MRSSAAAATAAAEAVSPLHLPVRRLPRALSALERDFSRIFNIYGALLHRHISKARVRRTYACPFRAFGETETEGETRSSDTTCVHCTDIY